MISPIENIIEAARRDYPHLFIERNLGTIFVEYSSLGIEGVVTLGSPDFPSRTTAHLRDLPEMYQEVPEKGLEIASRLQQVSEALIYIRDQCRMLSKEEFR